MKWSQLLSSTLREAPAEAEIPSHRLMLRAGMIRQVAGGIYTILPLGHRVLNKIMHIIREEMNAAGAQEVLLPIIQPANLWHESGRWDEYGDEMFRLKDRHGRSYALGPTHEEIVTSLVKNEVRSYRQLPLNLYQIQNKYRDEIRPRFGVMRGREFIMKDAYSFDTNEEALDQTYQRMFSAYERIFDRCGLQTRPVLADPGAIGGDSTHEFMVVSNTGEDEIAVCDMCTYAANVEKAEIRPRQDIAEVTSAPPMKTIDTPNVRTIEELAGFLKADPKQMIKTLVYLAEEEPVVVLIRGDRQLNEIKLARALECTTVQQATPEVVERITRSPVGFAGPVGLSGVKIFADYEVALIQDGITGANQENTHLVHVAYERDYRADAILDLRTVEEGDPCPQCDGTLKTTRGIEVGQVFKLGTKYSEALSATFLDENGTERHMVMGCYGIGVTRTMAAVIEQNHDEDGIIWPSSIAPFAVDIVVIDPENDDQMNAGMTLYDSLWQAGVETLIDDRLERPGVKFKDADLIGFPVRIVIGPKSLAKGHVEVRVRATRDVSLIALDQAVEIVRAQLESV